MTDLALSLLSEDRAAEALEVLDRIGPEGEASAEQLAYRGLALAKLGKSADALRLLRKAVEMAPYDARMNFLLAVQLRESGKDEEARKYAEAARVIDPKFSGLAGLLASLGVEAKVDPGLRLRQRLMNPLPPPPEGPVHAFPAIEQAEHLWTVSGWFLAVLNFVGIALCWIHVPMHMPAKGQPAGLPALGGLMPNSDPLSVFTIFLLVSVLILCCLWTFVDILDRRAKAVWFVPIIPFCCLGGMPGIALALYMALGRRS